MKKTVFLIALLLLFLMSKIFAQQPFQTWLTYNQQAKISNKWGYAFDLNFRTRGVFPFTASQSSARIGASYQLNNSTRFTAGFAWFGTHVAHDDKLFLHERRLYEQVQFTNIKHGLQYVNRIRLEQRFREVFGDNPFDQVGVAFTFRGRYLFQLQGPIKKKKNSEEVSLSWQVANEIFFQTGKDLDVFFDQNRTLAGFVISPSPKIDISVLYQLILQRQPVTETTQVINSVRLILSQKLDFRKKKN